MSSPDQAGRGGRERRAGGAERAGDWAHLQELLFADAWDERLRRHRSPYVFRGQPREGAGLRTSLMELGGPYGQLERHLLRNFRKYSPQGAAVANTVWHWLALAQHHGLPTRLLDWTFSPFVALHFATADLSLMEQDGEVWAVDFAAVHRRLPEPLRQPLEREGAAVLTIDQLAVATPHLGDLDEMSPEPFLLFFEPPAEDQRIVNQYALFSVYSDPWRSPEEWLRQGGLARRIVLPAELKWEVRDKLDQANITERTLFPGLDGLSRWLRRNYSARGEARD